MFPRAPYQSGAGSIAMRPDRRVRVGVPLGEDEWPVADERYVSRASPVPAARQTCRGHGEEPRPGRGMYRKWFRGSSQHESSSVRSSRALRADAVEPRRGVHVVLDHPGEREREVARA